MHIDTINDSQKIYCCYSLENDTERKNERAQSNICIHCLWMKDQQVLLLCPFIYDITPNKNCILIIDVFKFLFYSKFEEVLLYAI